jgi:hypothetical protein
MTGPHVPPQFEDRSILPKIAYRGQGAVAYFKGVPAETSMAVATDSSRVKKLSVAGCQSMV